MINNFNSKNIGQMTNLLKESGVAIKMPFTAKGLKGTTNLNGLKLKNSDGTDLNITVE